VRGVGHLINRANAGHDSDSHINHGARLSNRSTNFEARIRSGRRGIAK
jgi:hypothetical protein